ncbi:MAG: DNA/RNA nuclease SfsA [Smithellaceae bacterium]|nr:DNA/RNA nuclease SfsA [Smithellaceae bacterium]
MPAAKRNPTSGFRADRRLFSDLKEAFFLERPNRFVVRCLLDGHEVEAYLPNPGRLWELLLPGRKLYLAPQDLGKKLKLSYLVAAVERQGVPVMLHTHLTNDVAELLLKERRIRGLEDARVIRREATVGRSRFDFELEMEGRPFYLEVKSCSLFCGKIALFPDAVTERGKRHLVELAGLARAGTSTGVLFVVHWPGARFFLPDYHTDLEFSRTFCRLKDNLLFRAVAVGWDRSMSLSAETHEVSIPWHLMDHLTADRGEYLLSFNLQEERSVEIPGRGMIRLTAGHFLHLLSASKDLSVKMARHLKSDRKPGPSIGHILSSAASVHLLPIRSSLGQMEEITVALRRIASEVEGVANGERLFVMEEEPIHNERFIELLLHFRCREAELLLDCKRNRRQEYQP